MPYHDIPYHTISYYGRLAFSALDHLQRDNNCLGTRQTLSQRWIVRVGEEVAFRDNPNSGGRSVHMHSQLTNLESGILGAGVRDLLIRRIIRGRWTSSYSSKSDSEILSL